MTAAAYVTHGDLYSDPPRARVCLRCGSLVGDEDRHNNWHARHDANVAACGDDRGH